MFRSLFKDALKDLLDLKEPNEGTRRTNDLKSLQRQIKKVIGEHGILEEAEAKAPMRDIRSLPEWLTESVVDAAKLVIKFVLSKKSKDEFSDTGNKKLVALIRSFSAAFVRESSLLRKILMDDIELIYFSDHYPEMVSRDVFS